MTAFVDPAAAVVALTLGAATMSTTSPTPSSAEPPDGATAADVGQAAKYLGVSFATLTHADQRGEIKVVRSQPNRPPLVGRVGQAGLSALKPRRVDWKTELRY